MDSHSKINVISQKEQDEKLLAELAREEARNTEALRMVKEKELQAIAARDRAADSQRRMQDMVVKYEEMKQKLEWTRLTLEHTASQINQNDIKRAQQIQATVARLKEKAEHCSGILKKKREREREENDIVRRDMRAEANDILSESGTNLDSLMSLSMDDGGSLTEAEKMLLLMCQREASANQTANENIDETIKVSDMQTQEINQTSSTSLNQEVAYDDTSLTEAEKMLLLVCQKEKSVNNDETKDVKGLIGEEHSLQVAVKESINDISDKESSSDLAKENTVTDTERENVVTEEKTEVDHEDNKNNLSIECTATNSTVINIDALDAIESVEPNVSPPVKTGSAEASQDFDLKEATKDLKETVNNIEAKCAGVREELGQMAMSEQYMRTKQAQLFAKRREKEADLALSVASRKEQEAQDMRRKVANMMKLLEERRNKLKVTENVLETRSNVVDKVNKVLDSKLRKADFVQKQCDECLAFDISHKLIPNPEKQQTNNSEQTDTEELDAEQSTNVEAEQSTNVEAEPEKEVKDDKM
jgi:hypothetical protein